MFENKTFSLRNRSRFLNQVSSYINLKLSTDFYSYGNTAFSFSSGRFFGEIERGEM